MIDFTYRNFNILHVKIVYDSRLIFFYSRFFFKFLQTPGFFASLVRLIIINYLGNTISSLITFLFKKYFFINYLQIFLITAAPGKTEISASILFKKNLLLLIKGCRTILYITLVYKTITKIKYLDTKVI